MIDVNLRIKLYKLLFEGWLVFIHTLNAMGLEMTYSAMWGCLRHGLRFYLYIKKSSHKLIILENTLTTLHLKELNENKA